MFIAIILIKRFKILKSEKSSQVFGSLYEEIDITRKSAVMFNVVFVSRRLLFAIIVVTLRGAPYL